jgi:manganese/zinc/iron transport system ATP- binding protein
VSLALRLRDVTVDYRADPVVWDVDLDVPEGSLTAIIGPNGAGKSSLLKAALDLIPRSSGTVEFYGRKLNEARARVAYVPQRSAVDWEFPASVLDVVLMGLIPRLGWLKIPGRQDRQAALSALGQLGLVDLADRPISDLSGGQQQRVFLARALVQGADLLVMDEPFAAVDATTEEEIVRILVKHRSEGRSALVVHHDLESARTLFDRALLLNVKKLHEGPIEEALTQENLRKAYGWAGGAAGLAG